jgi:DNA mismatch endonuclease (patch repair protein)
MADIFSKEKRSEVMSRIRGKNTGPEVAVFRFLRKRGIYFQKHYKRVKGCPDIALPRKKRAVFIDGGFWHGHDFEKRKEKLLAADQYYWVEKIERNMERDVLCRSALTEKGWSILQVWDHRIVKKSTRDQAFEEIAAFLRGA